MIVLHRMTHPDEALYVNPDLIQTIEATPDTVVTLTNAGKLLVSETPAEVVARIRAWRGSILTAAITAPEVKQTGDLQGALAEVLQLPLDRR